MPVVDIIGAGPLCSLEDRLSLVALRYPVQVIV